MSHQPERKEKDCLNCSTLVHGRYCHVCGQENIIPHQNFWSLSKHFVYDIFHFDGKFFDTLRYLLFRPGRVPREYIQGKRTRYLDPIRMYLFTSAIFFIIFFTLYNPQTLIKPHTPEDIYLSKTEKQNLIKVYKKRLEKKPQDTALLRKIALLSDSTALVKDSDISTKKEKFVIFYNTPQDTKEAYDSAQRLLPANKRDGWLKQKMIVKTFAINEKYKDDRRSAVVRFLDIAFHQLPYLLFFSLPFFALILKLLYIRRKRFFYSDHAVFTLYHYIFSFILLLVYLGFLTIVNKWKLGFLGFILFGLSIAWPIYLYIALKRFYGQGRLKTFAKFVLLNILGFFVVSLLMILFFIFSVFQL